MIISGNHVMDYPDGPMNTAPPKRKGDDAGIIIEDDVWIGAGAIILDGAHISQGSIVGAGAVLTRYIPPYCIAAGNPCKPIRSRFTRGDLLNVLSKLRTNLTIEQIDSIYIQHSIEYKPNACPPI
jgi:acetyltransferase-like isoleucine patch superfamily enzyme